MIRIHQSLFSPHPGADPSGGNGGSNKTGLTRIRIHQSLFSPHPGASQAQARIVHEVSQSEALRERVLIIKNSDLEEIRFAARAVPAKADHAVPRGIRDNLRK